MDTTFSLPNGQVVPLANIDKIGEVITTDNAASFIIYMKNGRPPEVYECEFEYADDDLLNEDDAEYARKELLQRWNTFLAQQPAPAPPPVKKDKIISLKANGDILVSQIAMVGSVLSTPEGHGFMVHTFLGPQFMVNFPYIPSLFPETTVKRKAESKAQAEAYRAEVMADWTAYHA